MRKASERVQTRRTALKGKSKRPAQSAIAFPTQDRYRRTHQSKRGHGEQRGKPRPLTGDLPRGEPGPSACQCEAMTGESGVSRRRKATAPHRSSAEVKQRSGQAKRRKQKRRTPLRAIARKGRRGRGRKDEATQDQDDQPRHVAELREASQTDLVCTDRKWARKVATRADG